MIRRKPCPNWCDDKKKKHASFYVSTGSPVVPTQPKLKHVAKRPCVLFCRPPPPSIPLRANLAHPPRPMCPPLLSRLPCRCVVPCLACRGRCWRCWRRHSPSLSLVGLVPFSARSLVIALPGVPLPASGFCFINSSVWGKKKKSLSRQGGSTRTTSTSTRPPRASENKTKKKQIIKNRT